MPDLGVCRAAVPVTRITAMTGRMLGDSPVIDHLSTEPDWQECGSPATAVHEYVCPVGHTKRRETCAEHAPEPGAVGCRECWDAGTEQAMTFREVARG